MLKLLHDPNITPSCPYSSLPLVTAHQANPSHPASLSWKFITGTTALFSIRMTYPAFSGKGKQQTSKTSRQGFSMEKSLFMFVALIGQFIPHLLAFVDIIGHPTWTCYCTEWLHRQIQHALHHHTYHCLHGSSHMFFSQCILLMQSLRISSCRPTMH